MAVVLRSGLVDRLPAIAWGDRTRAYQAVLIAGYLAGNEAETHLFGLDRLALLDRDPDAALRTARAAWEDLTEDERLAPAAHTVRHALAHVERRVLAA